MKELEMKEKASKSLLANVLDMDDDFRYTYAYRKKYHSSFSDRWLWVGVHSWGWTGIH